MRFRGCWLLAMALLLAASACAPALAQPATQTPVRVGTLELAPGSSQASLAPHTRYYHDADGGDPSGDVFLRLADERAFAPLPDGKAAFGFQDGAFWFHARIVNRNADEPRWMLVQRYALSDRVDVYARFPDGRIVHYAGGDFLPFSARSIPYRHPNFRLDLPVGESVDLLVRVQSASSMLVPLDLYTPSEFTSLSRDSQFVMGVYYGILMALFVYNLALWLALRDASYFWYLLHISGMGLTLFTLNGYAFEYLWPESAWLANVAMPLSICIATVCMQQFARTFLELPQRFPIGNRISLAFMAFFAALGAASFWLSYQAAITAASRVGLVTIFWVVFAAFVVLRRGYGPAKLFLLAWSMMLLGAILWALLAFGVVPKNLFTEYGVQIGSALEMLLLSIALSYRYASLRNENERIVNEANQQLERKVAQRTQEVRSALTQLEDAHRRLHDSSRRDGLTGLYNRTHFHESFEALLRDGRQCGQPVSLLMIDLDHFKAINDKYGHLAGDDCLRWAAQKVGQALRTYDSALLARFGGEEFVVVLPGHDLFSAVDVAESLRRRLTEEPCASGPHRLKVSASIGVHTIDAGTDTDGDTALSAADKALYSAKAGGRDRVHSAITA